MNFGTVVPWRANYQMTRRRAWREAAYLEQNEGPRRLLQLDGRELNQRAEGKKNFFILGSGASVNDLTLKQREEIESGFSVGLNSWAFNGLIPDAYALENPRQAGFEPQIAAINAGLRRPEVIERTPVVFWFRDGPTGLPSGKISVPRELEATTQHYGRLQFGPARVGQIDLLIQRFFRESLKGQLPHHVLLDNGSSVVRMVTLAALLGFETVVLVGVDLGRRPYFFEEDSTALEAIGQRPFTQTLSEGSHPSESREWRTMPFLDFLQSLTGVLRNERGTATFAASEILSEHLPPYRWG
jgi:hypothetical protein